MSNNFPLGSGVLTGSPTLGLSWLQNLFIIILFLEALQSLYSSPTRALASPRGILLTSQPPSRSSLLPHFPCSNSLEISLRPPAPPSPASCQGGRYWINIIIVATIFVIIIFIIGTLKVAAIWRGTDQSPTEFASQQSAPGEVLKIFNESKKRVFRRNCFSLFPRPFLTGLEVDVPTS